MRRFKIVAVCVTMCAGAQTAVAAEEPVQAVWKPQELVFYYQSFTTFYSCDSLEQKLERILLQLGAASTVRVRAANCSQGPVSFPRAEISLVAPVEATPDALAELEEGESTRELVARVTGARARAEELGQQFPAQWKRVEVGRGPGAPNLESGDCELLDQVRRKILPSLAVRVLEGTQPCPRNTGGLLRPKLVVEALIAMPRPDDVMPDADEVERDEPASSEQDEQGSE